MGKIAVTSKKGGVGKTTIAVETAYMYNYDIVSCDSDNESLDDFENLKIIHVNENEIIPKLDNVVYDFPAGDLFNKFPNFKKIIKKLDLIIIPVDYEKDSAQRAVRTYQSIIEQNKNILFVFTMMNEEQHYEEIKGFIEESLNEEVAMCKIRYSKGIKNAKFEDISIFTLADRASPLIRGAYKKGILKDYIDLFEIISEVLDAK